MVKNAKTMEVDPYKRILLVGPPGSGKSSQIWTLPGKKFAYIFDANTVPTIKGCDVDYEMFLPQPGEVDTSLKGFSRGSKSDKPRKRLEPTVYRDWEDDWNERDEAKFFASYDWLIIDSITSLSHAIMARILFLNGRYGDLEERSDYMVGGSKLSDIFTAISGMPINVFATGHTRVYEDDKTQKIEAQLNLPGRARQILPMTFTDTWLTTTRENDEHEVRHFVRTKPENRGFKGIRCTIPNLDIEEDVMIEDYDKATSYGIGALLNGGDIKENKDAKNQARTR